MNLIKLAGLLITGYGLFLHNHDTCRRHDVARKVIIKINYNFDFHTRPLQDSWAAQTMRVLDQNQDKACGIGMHPLLLFTLIEKYML